MLQPLFGLAPPDWTEKGPDQGMLALLSSKAAAEEGDSEDESADDDEDADEEEEGDAEE